MCGLLFGELTMRGNSNDNHFLAVDNQQAHNMVFMQWWLTCMLPALDFQISFISLNRTDGIGNATTA